MTAVVLIVAGWMVTGLLLGPLMGWLLIASMGGRERLDFGSSGEVIGSMILGPLMLAVGLFAAVGWLLDRSMDRADREQAERALARAAGRRIPLWPVVRPVVFAAVVLVGVVLFYQGVISPANERAARQRATWVEDQCRSAARPGQSWRVDRGPDGRAVCLTWWPVGSVTETS